MAKRRPNYPDLLGEPSPALLRLQCSKDVAEVDGFIKAWEAEAAVLKTKDQNPEREKLINRLEALILRGKSRRRQLRQGNMRR